MTIPYTHAEKGYQKLRKIWFLIQKVFFLNWFRLNSLKANPGKFQFMILGDKSHHKHELKINSIKVEASDDVLLLGITIDKKLTFKQHVENLCRKAQYKLHALRRIRKFLTIEKVKMLGNAFIGSQFNYAPLLWMFCRRTLKT